MTKKPGRAVLVAAAMLLLLTAMWAGLYRMGWRIPPLQPTLSGVHGPLMISGFLGTLIGLERAVGLRMKWTYAAPALAALGALVLAVGLSGWLGALLITLSSLVLCAMFVYITRHQPFLHSVTMLVGAVAWFVGNLLWLFGQPISVAVAWWAGYLILTIAGERLELSRMLQLSAFRRNLFVGAIGLYLVGAAVVVLDYVTGWRITGLGMVALAVWLLLHDIARRTIKLPGLTRYIGFCMLGGYVWLLVGGVLAVIYGFLVGGSYDAVLHSVFLGFVFGMIFGHAPVIFPAVLGVPIPMRQAFYSHLILLHASVVLRVAAGVAEWQPGRLWAAMLNVVALLLFIFNTVLAARAGLAQQAATATARPRRA